MIDVLMAQLAALDITKEDAIRALMAGDPVDTLKLLLGVSELPPSALFALELVKERILDYINHDEIPNKLRNAWAIMTFAYYKNAGLGSAAISTGPVSSVKRGDVTTSFATGDGTASGGAFSFEGDGGLFNWRTVLNPHRKFRK